MIKRQSRGLYLLETSLGSVSSMVFQRFTDAALLSKFNESKQV